MGSPVKFKKIDNIPSTYNRVLRKLDTPNDQKKPMKLLRMKFAPKLATGDGALGFWAALRKVFPETREQRCWLHKTANVLNHMPKSVQPRAKADLHEIWMAETRGQASRAFDAFLEKYGPKYPTASECLKKDREVLLAFYDFPAEHWLHLRTTNTALKGGQSRATTPTETRIPSVHRSCQ